MHGKKQFYEEDELQGVKLLNMPLRDLKLCIWGAKLKRYDTLSLFFIELLGAQKDSLKKMKARWRLNLSVIGVEKKKILLPQTKYYPVVAPPSARVGPLDTPLYVVTQFLSLCIL